MNTKLILVYPMPSIRSPGELLVYKIKKIKKRTTETHNPPALEMNLMDFMDTSTSSAKFFKAMGSVG